MAKNLTFVIGQCWISDTELELGVGKVHSVEQRKVTFYFLLADEYRTYSSANAPLTRLKFSLGDNLTFLSQDNDKLSFQITEIAENEGLISYTGITENTGITVSESEIHPIVKINRPVERLFNQQIDQSKWFDLRYQTYQHLNRLQTSPLTGLAGGRISLIPHQLYIIHEIASRYAPRVLLADEVGLGKTIEAGGILHHQIITGKVNRALIIVPESLVFQWLVEMKRKFNLNFSVFNEERCLAEEHSELVDNPFDSAQLVICSLDFISTKNERFRQIQSTSWDILVVDEAHHLLWNEDQSSHEYDCIEQLGQHIESILLLTATPEQLGKESHFARLRLLDPERYQNYQQFISDEQSYEPIAKAIENLYAILQTKSQSVLDALTKTQWQEIEQQIDDLAIITKLKKLDSQDEKVESIIEQLSHQLLDYHGTGRVLIRNTRASISGFPKRKPKPVPLTLPEQYQANVLSPETVFQSDNLKEQNKWLNFDPRVKWLIQLIKNSPDKKIVLITAYAQTVKQLHQYLKQKENIVTAVFHEEMTLLERDRAAAYFADEESNCPCILCSEIGSEGRNFQFSSDLILFDLPENPDLLEQRIGRLDRIGQKNDISLHLPYFEKSAQEWMYRWYHEGLNAFNANCPSAFQVYSEFQSEIHTISTGLIAEAKLKTLIDKSCRLKDELNYHLEQGRDKLLEYNSCRQVSANKLSQQINQNERLFEISHYLDKLFDCVGLDTEVYRDKSFLLTETDEIQYPIQEVGSDGLIYTCDRETALSNEDMAYFTWEHPLINQLMDKIINEDQGTTSMITFTHPKIKPGQLFMEVLFVLTINENLSHVQRILVNLEGNNISAKYPEGFIGETIQNLDKDTIQGLVQGYVEELQSMKKSAEQHMQSISPDLIEQLSKRQLGHIKTEIKRLEELQKINAMVRDVEIERYQNLYNELKRQSANAYTSLDALRVMIST